MNDIKNEDQKLQNPPSPAPVSNPIKEGAPLGENVDVIASSETTHEITLELSDMKVEEEPFPHDQIKIKSDPKAPPPSVSVPPSQAEIDAPLKIDTAIIEAANPDKTRSRTWLGAIIEKALGKIRQRKKLPTSVARPA